MKPLKLNKIQVTRKFQKHRLEGLPAKVYASDKRPTLAQLSRDFGEVQALMIRTGSIAEVRNLPRTAGVSPLGAAAWIAALPESLDIIIQPYDPVVFSVEVVVYDNGYVAELVPGIWELSTDIQPATLTFMRGAYQLEWIREYQSATFHTLEQGYFRRPARLEDWQISSLAEWMQNRRSQVEQLQSEFDEHPIGIKVHYAARYGLSPQNIRTNVPGVEDGTHEKEPGSLVRITNIDDPIVVDSAVVLDISIAREEQDQLSVLIARLIEARVRAIYLKSGLLSHLAIALREAGFKVRRFNAAILRD